MRTLIVTGLVSLDGFACGPDGNFMAMPLDGSFSAYNVERLRTADTLLLGRTTYEGFRSYWPAVADDERQPEIEREISRRNTAAAKVVVSDTLTPADTTGWGTDTRIVARAEAPAAVAELKRGDGADILVFGSTTTWNALLPHGLVDEVHLMIGPGTVGRGLPAFAAEAVTGLRLLGARQLPDSEHVLLTYAASDVTAVSR